MGYSGACVGMRTCARAYTSLEKKSNTQKRKKKRKQNRKKHIKTDDGPLESHKLCQSFTKFKTFNPYYICTRFIGDSCKSERHLYKVNARFTRGIRLTVCAISIHNSQQIYRLKYIIFTRNEQQVHECGLLRNLQELCIYTRSTRVEHKVYSRSVRPPQMVTKLAQGLRESYTRSV